MVLSSNRRKVFLEKGKDGFLGRTQNAVQNRVEANAVVDIDIY